MSQITRTYSFTDGTTAYGSQVETEVQGIVTSWNNHDSGSSSWTALAVTGNGTIGGTLGVTGAATLSSTLAITGAVTFNNLTATTVPYLSAAKVLTSSAVTPTELGYVSGVTSAIQTQMGLKAPLASPTFSGTITTALTASRVVKTNGSSALTTGAVDLTSSNEVTGSLPVANGGTATTTKLLRTGTYTGNGSTQSVAHGLGVAPDFVLISVTGTGNNVGHIFITGMTNSHDLNGTNQVNGITSVDSTNINLGANAAVNSNAVAYAFVAFKMQ